MKISIDFDETLEYEKIQELAKKIIENKHEVCILTTRYKDCTDNSRLYRIAHELGIKEIHFTEWEWKHTVIDNFNIDAHIDDYYFEVDMINKLCKAKAFCTEYADWEKNFNNFLEGK